MATVLAWQCRHAASVTARFAGPMRMGSWKSPLVKATEWWKPAVIKGSININSEETFYVRNGDIIWRVSFYVSIIILLFTFVASLRARFGAKQ